jgi:cytochrome c-type biogenesis protein CcmH
LIKNIEGKNALLYVYAKAATGMPMPIAVIKRPLHNTQNNAANIFPIQISLSDSNNLQATRKLSSFDDIIVGARISFSGNAMAQAGDLQSAETKVKLVDQPQVELLIEKIR